MKGILLGYEIGTAKPVHIPLSHLIVTGITQLSGKTTTLEALIHRAGLRAVVFKTKIGESGFSEGNLIPPYFLERADWQYFASLLEATLKERLKFERPWIMRACKGADSLLEVKANIDRFLAAEKLRAMDRDIFLVLQEYLAMVLPQLQYANFSKVLSLGEGINIMDLERFREEVQSLVIRSVLETALKELRETVVVMPEVWKFLPQGRGNPSKPTAEAFIRQGATNKNYLWFDCQDLAGVDKGPLKQVSTWILGLQQERNEVVHTLDQIPLPKRQKPKEDEIMTLGLGHFFVCTPTFTAKVYVQPVWLDDKTAKAVAKGETKAENIKRPSRIAPYSIQRPQPAGGPDNFEVQKFIARTQGDIAQLREDFFSKIQQVAETVRTLQQEVFKFQGDRPDINNIASLVLQKLPIQTQTSAMDKEAIISAVLQRVPRIAGTVTYEVAPLEKIRRDFLEEARQKILNDVQNRSSEQKKILKFVETQGRGCNINQIVTLCFHLKGGGGTAQKIRDEATDLANGELLRKDVSHGLFHPSLRKRISDLTECHGAKPEEIQQVYDHILAEMLR